MHGTVNMGRYSVDEDTLVLLVEQLMRLLSIAVVIFNVLTSS